ncbi:MAG: flagellin lysine-N-methylase [Lachnospiraceae bacterium]|nr:flagellin lysine-N-methylase [Lachnospiraceae bacterium]
MFKLIKVDFYDDFSCLMSDCNDNCCDEDWDIYIDEETIEKYEKLGVPDLYTKITRDEPHRLIKHDHKCPFITPEGLCLFHRDYGEEYLSNTCRSYPRFVSTYGDVYLETLGMSCPATVQIILKLKKPVIFPEKIYYEDQNEVGIIPDRKENEICSRNIISEFKPGECMIATYKRLYRELSGGCGVQIKKKHELLAILKEKTYNTPSERYFRELFDGDHTDDINDSSALEEDGILTELETRLSEICYTYSCNVNRMWLFEHLMLNSLSDTPDNKEVIRQGLNIWILLLMSLEYKMNRKKDIDEDALVECTYRIMRIMDHGGDIFDHL